MTRPAATDRARHATAYLEAASIAAEYIRTGVKIECAIQDHGVSAGTTGTSWGVFIGALASRILARVKGEGVVG